MKVLIIACVLLWPLRVSAQVAPFPEAPLCPSHDNRTWHSLWDASRGCHYDHQHGDNPHEVDDLFGTSLYGLMGGEISHPWQTFSPAGYENDVKHAGYFWHVRRNIPAAPGQTTYLTAFRVLVHQHPTGRDAAVRFHSGVIEAITNDGGSIQIPGAWVDFGDLIIDGVLPPAIDEPNNGNRHKQHSNGPGTNIIWYGATQTATGGQGFARISPSVHDVWDHTAPGNISNTTDYVCYPAGNCQSNATSLRPHLIQVQVPSTLRTLVDPDGNGRADWQGYTTRYGAPVTGCAAPSLDCVPVTLVNLRTIGSYACDQVCGQYCRDYDIYFNGQTSGWSQPVP